MCKNGFKRSAVLAMGAAILTCAAVSARAAGPVSLRRVFTSGDADRYKIIFTIVSRGTSVGTPVRADMGMMVTETITGVRDGGQADAVWQLERGALAYGGGAPQALPGTPLSFSVTYGANSVAVAPPAARTIEQYRLGSVTRLFQLVLPQAVPAAPLAVGSSTPVEMTFTGAKSEKWSGKVAVQALEPDVKPALAKTVKVVTTLEGVLHSEEIVMKANQPEVHASADKVQVEIASYLDPNTFKPIRREGRIACKPLDNTAGVTVTFLMVRTDLQPGRGTGSSETAPAATPSTSTAPPAPTGAH